MPTPKGSRSPGPNVVVRLLTLDEPEQAERAKRLLGSHTIFLPKTVLLETEWVLRRLYGFASTRVAAALRGLLALQNVRCEDLGAARSALDWVDYGLDFADALHLASSAAVGHFATFDANLRDRARKLPDIAVLEP
jgi:predicted nucleic acid-binding protein